MTPPPLIKIDLTARQRKALAPLFRAVAIAHADGVDTALAAQVYPDGVVVRLANEKQIAAIQKAFGHVAGRPCATATERMAREPGAITEPAR